jgi:hypothetical protein
MNRGLSIQIFLCTIVLLIVLSCGCTSPPQVTGNVPPLATTGETALPTPTPSPTPGPTTHITTGSCGGWSYDSSNQTCALDIATGSLSVVPVGRSVCAKTEFDTSSQVCVLDEGTTLYSIAPAGYGLCNGIQFNNSTHYCARDDGSYSSNAATRPWVAVRTGERACYGSAYNRTTQACVVGAGIIESLPCSAGTASVGCCNGRSYPNSSYNCCGGRIYDNKSWGCCRNEIYDPRAWTCLR